MAGTMVTTDHAQIRAWVEERGGTPACVRGERELRVVFPGQPADAALELVGWDEWFRLFEERGLCFGYPGDQPTLEARELRIEITPRAAPLPTSAAGPHKAKPRPSARRIRTGLT
jgi:hypothetical protein